MNFVGNYVFCFFLLETGQIDPILIERYNTPGFVGCLSRVQFNSVAPLKAALRSGQGAPGSAKGILVPSNCGASPLTISPMASAADPWHFEAGRHTQRSMTQNNETSWQHHIYQHVLCLCSWSSFPLQRGQGHRRGSRSELRCCWRSISQTHIVIGTQQ